MPTTATRNRDRLPGRFNELAEIVPPRAILNESQLDKMIAMIDRLMAAARLTKGQAHYLETLVQLTQTYEANHHPIDTAGITGLDTLRHLLDDHGMNASDLARLLGVHVSMGSKLLKGDRSLTVEHLLKLAEHFKVSPEVFVG